MSQIRWKVLEASSYTRRQVGTQTHSVRKGHDENPIMRRQLAKLDEHPRRMSLETLLVSWTAAGETRRAPKEVSLETLHVPWTAAGETRRPPQWMTLETLHVPFFKICVLALRPAALPTAPSIRPNGSRSFLRVCGYLKPKRLRESL